LLLFFLYRKFKKSSIAIVMVYFLNEIEREKSAKISGRIYELKHSSSPAVLSGLRSVFSVLVLSVCFMWVATRYFYIMMFLVCGGLLRRSSLSA